MSEWAHPCHLPCRHVQEGGLQRRSRGYHQEGPTVTVDRDDARTVRTNKRRAGDVHSVVPLLGAVGEVEKNKLNGQAGQPSLRLKRLLAVVASPNEDNQASSPSTEETSGRVTIALGCRDWPHISQAVYFRPFRWLSVED